MSGKKRDRRWGLVLVPCAIILVVVAITGPVYAFVFMSCVSTRTCRIGALLAHVGGVCEEGSGERSESLLHGETCTVKCSLGYQATTGKLECDDGTTRGADDLRCVAPSPRPWRAPQSGALVDNAVTGGELHTVCARAAALRCKGAPGGTAMFVMLSGLSVTECSELLEECRETNSAFAWMQHVVDDDTGGNARASSTGGGSSGAALAVGTCELGCYGDRDIEEVVAPQTAAPAIPSSRPDPKHSSDLCGGATSPEMPLCIAVGGSCNDGDDGDYYRYHSCADELPQWVRHGGSHRIRYDGKPQYSQGGKWILEMGADPTADAYAYELARQSTFGTVPVFGTYGWDFKCRTRVNSFTYTLVFSKVDLTLGACTCTDMADCSGHGRALGDKELGPNCRCVCDDGWDGEHCELPLCRVPDVLHALIPACAEGPWVMPGAKCTASCESGFNPSVAELRCADDGSAFAPRTFACIRGIAVVKDLGGEAAAQYVGSTTSPPPCEALDCSFRGTPNGERGTDGKCICECDDNFEGDACLTFVGACRAPLEISNAPSTTCKEGSTIHTTCTARCDDKYWPEPKELYCTMGDVLVGSDGETSFKCFGGESVRDEWCKLMKYLAFASSGVALLALLGICCCKPDTGRKTGPVIVGTETIEYEKDDEGNYSIVRMKNTGKVSQLPPKLKASAEARAEAFGLKDSQEAALPSSALMLDDRFPDSSSVAAASIRPPGNLRRLATVPFEEIDPNSISDLPRDVVVASRTDSFVAGTQATKLGSARSGNDKANSSVAVSDAAFIEAASLLALPAPTAVDSSVAARPQANPAITQRAPTAGHRPTLPPEGAVVHTAWLMRLRELDENSQATRKAAAVKGHTEKLSVEQRAAIESASALDAALEATEAERADTDEALRDALRKGDAVALRMEVARSKALLERVVGAPAATTASIDRLVKISEARLEQLEERDASRERRDAWAERVRRGDAADWKMTPQEFWAHVDAANVGHVRGGLKAKLPLMSRSTDGKRNTIVHIACRCACAEADGSEMDARRLSVVSLLLEARANANMVDSKDRTPLDLAVCELGTDVELPPIHAALRDLGLRTAREAAAELLAEGNAPRT